MAKDKLRSWQEAVDRNGIAAAFGVLLVEVRKRAADGDADCLACLSEFHRLRAEMWDAVDGAAF